MCVMYNTILEECFCYDLGVPTKKIPNSHWKLPSKSHYIIDKLLFREPYRNRGKCYLPSSTYLSPETPINYCFCQIARLLSF